MIKRKIILLTFLFVLVVKSLSVWYMSHITGCMHPDSSVGLWAISGGDTYSYIQPAENLYTSGTYFYINEQGEYIYAGRMPYYGLFYILFRFFFERSAAGDALIFLQVLLESLAVVAVCLIVFHVAKSRTAYFCALTIGIISVNITHWSQFLLPESLGISFLIFFLYNYYLFSISGQRKKLVYSSIFLAFVIVLKPYYIFIYLFLLFDWLRISENRIILKFKNLIINSIISGGVLLMILSPWIFRNYKVYNKFVPAQITLYAGINYSKAELAWREYVSSWGGSIIHWDKKAAGCYFKPTPGINCEYELPPKAVPQGFTVKDIEILKNEFISLNQNFDPVRDTEIQQKFMALKEAIKVNDPLQYYIISRISLTADFLFHSGSYYLPAESNSECYNYLFQLPVKLMQSVLYYITLIVGFSGLVLFGFRNRFLQLMLFIVLMLIFIFAIVLRTTEYRYFFYSYYLLVVGASLVLESLTARSYRYYIQLKEMNIKKGSH